MIMGRPWRGFIEMATMRLMCVPGTTVNRKRCKIIASEIARLFQCNPTECHDWTMPATKPPNASNRIKKEVQVLAPGCQPGNLRRFHRNLGERADGKHPIFMRRLSLR